VNQLFVGIDVGSRDNAVYIMLPDGSKHSSFAVQNNLGGAQTLSKRVVGALIEKNGSSPIPVGSVRAKNNVARSFIWYNGMH